MGLQLLQTDRIDVPFGLHKEEQTESQHAHGVGRDFAHGDKPRLLVDHMEVVLGNVHLDGVPRLVVGIQDVYANELIKGCLEAVEGGRAWLFADKSGKASTVNREDSGFDLVVYDVPTNSDNHLETYQTNRVRSFVFGGVVVPDFEHAGDHAPCFRVGVGGGRGEVPAGVLELVAFVAEGDSSLQVFFVSGDNLVEGVFFVAVEVPVSKNDMIEAHYVVNIEVFRAVAVAALDAFVHLDPFGVTMGDSDTTGDAFKNLVHATLYKKIVRF